LAGHEGGKEIRDVAKALTQARERSSDDARRQIVVLRAALQAREERTRAFIVEHADELRRSLLEQAQGIVAETEGHLRAAASLRGAYMAVSQSTSELLLATEGNTQALPSSDSANSFYRDLARFAETSLAVPAPRRVEAA
jgi:hypothetical protein